MSQLIDKAQRFGLPDFDINNAKEYIDEGEYECCSNILIVQLYEYSIAIDEEFYALVCEAYNRMKLPENEYAFLKELIKPL